MELEQRTTKAEPLCPGPSNRGRMILFLAGEERNSQLARANLTRIVEEYLAGYVELEIVDVLSDHRKALEWRVLLTPTLLVFRSSSNPLRITGTIESPDRILNALGFTRFEAAI